MNGVSALLVLITASSPWSSTSQPQPLPNCDADVFTKAFVNASVEPNLRTIAAWSFSLGCVVTGLSEFQ
ncbi:MAG: hypothetical protein QOD67_4095 [Caballeronia sp.]|nr:hypothetical protein [Caballeronia sp.]